MTRLDRWEQRTGPWLTGLALLSFGTLVLDGLMESGSSVVLVVDVAAWATFAADYAYRIYLAEDRWSFIRSHPLDLAAVALPALRVLRLIASLARVAALAGRGLTERVMVTTTLVAVTVVIGAASTVLDAERHAPEANITNFPDALWWAATTVTTVGYGDRFPVTAEGRLIGVVLMAVGIAVFGSITAALAGRLIQAGAAEADDSQARDRIREARGHGGAVVDGANTSHRRERRRPARTSAR
ncbi:MAG TPA: potassium channel family protein [Jiangellaceae bacterium]|nr:potassium channel family protein [Jiangellaceae bacterium]